MSHDVSAEAYAFQVDLRGLVDLLSQHLYSSPRVYIRELLQNAVDAHFNRGAETRAVRAVRDPERGRGFRVVCHRFRHRADRG